MSSTLRRSFQRAMRTAATRWRNHRAAQGLFAVLAGLFVCSAVAIPVMQASQFEPATVSTVRALMYLLLFVLVLVFIVMRIPGLRDRHRLVEHLEPSVSPRNEQAPGSENTLLLTAAQMDAAGADAPLEQRLYERATEVINDPEGGTREDRVGLRRVAFASLALVCVMGSAVFLMGDGARHGMKLLLVPWLDAQQDMPYRIAVEPGDAVVREHTDLVVNGDALGFAPSDLTLLYRTVGDASWTRLSMRAPVPTQGDPAAESQPGKFSAQLFAVTEPFEYYVEGGNVRSSTHRIDVRYLPRAQRIDHVYRYPRYTGIEQKLVESATDIAAVTGTTVQIRVVPDSKTVELSSSTRTRGELVLDDRTRRPLTLDGDVLLASLSVDEASRYRIELFADDPRGDGEMVPVTPDHGIAALADGAPVVTVARPGSDARVSAVEEIEVQIQADDDVSLRQVELVYSINGEPEEVVSLTPDNTSTIASDSLNSTASVTATHTLYLEERNLKAGDVISYHARASDGVVSRMAITDIQFMDVRPFDRDYRPGRSGRGGGGGGGGGDGNLAAQQRDLVVALFRLARDGQRLDEEEQTNRLTTLSDAQKRIRGRVEAIVRRIRGRALMQSAPGYAVMLDVMPKAITAMMRVESLLAVPDAEQSLPLAREALAHLQRADAAFREVQVASGQGGRGGGGGGRVGNSDLSRLFELEMDRFRNRYSQVQRARAPQRQQQVDETLDKLKELARRQREEIERARRRAQRPQAQNAAGNGAGASQQGLAQALDELLRQLERLSREQSSGAMSAAKEAMRQAAQSMRQSAQTPQRTQTGSQSGTSQSTRQGGTQGGRNAQSGQKGGERNSANADPNDARTAARKQAAAAESAAVQSAREALERLNAARQALAADGNDQVSREVREARQRVRSLVHRQDQVIERLQLGEQTGGISSPDTSGNDGSSAPTAQSGAAPAGNGGRSIDELKAGMQVDAQQLREQLDRIASAVGTKSQVRAPARRAGEVMREEDVEGRLRHSRQQLTSGQSYGSLESSISQALRRVQEQIEQAAAASDAQLSEDPAATRLRQANAGTSDDQSAASTRQGGQSAGRRGAGISSAGDPAVNAERLREMMRGLAGLRERMGPGGGNRPASARTAGPGGRSLHELRALTSDLSQLTGVIGSGSSGTVASNYDPAADLRALLEGIEALATETAVEGTQVSDALLAALERVERFVKDSVEAEHTVVPTGRDARTPPQYRTLVEAYYRRLSEVGDRPTVER